MTRTAKKYKFNVARFLGIVVLPLIAGALLGVAGCYYLYNKTISNIENCVIKEVSIEYGHPITLDSFFTVIPPNTKFITAVDQIDPGLLQTYDIAIDCGGHVVHSALSIVDRTAPTGKAVPYRMYAGKAPAPEELITDIFDLTAVSLSYDKGEPDLTQGGDYSIGVRLTDANGNYSVVDVPFRVIKDTEPPMIFGTHDFDVVAGKVETIAYREGIIVTDNYAVNPTLEIDNSQVDLKKVGDYDLIYRATDDVGNVTEVTVQVHVVITGRGSESSAEIRAYEEKARKMAADINKKILKSSDTDVVKAMKIFYWVHNNIRFVLHTPQYSNWAVAAINTFTKRYSSCYGTWAVCKAMLDAEGIENICVVRKVSRAHPNYHYWCLVKLNGEWYHCDAQKYFDGTSKKYFTFMMTDKEIIAAPSDHTFEKSKYPERSTKSVQKYIDVYSGKIKSGFPYKKDG